MDCNAANELLLSCLRGEPDEYRLAQLSGADWQAIVQQADRHAVAPLLYRSLTAPNFKAHVPADIVQTLRTIYLEFAWSNTRLYNEFAKVLKALRQADIPVVVLKGAHLAQAVYGNIALRPMSDVDILVKKNDLLQARETLLELGYASSSESGIETACAMSHHLPPMTKQGAAAVEIHWTLESPLYPIAIDAEELWTRARTSTVADVEVLVLSPEDLLLHLCLHTGFHHLYKNGLRAFCDIRETIRHHRDELDWETAIARARQWGTGNSVYLTLHLAEKLLGADVPEELLARHRPDSFSPHLIIEAEKMIFGEHGIKISHQLHLTKLLNSMSALDTTRLSLQRLFLSRKELADKYGIAADSPRIWLHYPLRLKDMIARHGRTVLQLWRRDETAVRQLRLIDWLGH